MNEKLQVFWQKLTPVHGLLFPFMACFYALVVIRKYFLTKFFAKSVSVPIIVVGNLTTGGVGKTPLVIALVEAFKARNIAVGVISRGYKAQCKHFPYQVKETDLAHQVGDEPLLIAYKTGVPVVIAPDRVAAANYLLAHHVVQVIISDDGLQHYRMARAVEIAVIDGMRLLGNQHLLPVGPLREPMRRLQAIDFIIVNEGSWPNAYRMTLAPGDMMSVKDKLPVLTPIQSPVAAVAGIGNPGRFFQTLSNLSITYQPYIFPDHHLFMVEDFKNLPKTILMTEKDAVKCQPFATDAMYFLPVTAKIELSFWDALWEHPALTGII